jgi:hypothetical protein
LITLRARDSLPCKEDEEEEAAEEEAAAAEEEEAEEERPPLIPPRPARDPLPAPFLEGLSKGFLVLVIIQFLR